MTAYEGASSVDSPFQGGMWRSVGGYGVYWSRQTRVWRPPTDVYETPEHIVIRVEVAGMREEDFNISLVDRRLIIAGHRAEPPLIEPGNQEGINPSEERLSYQNMEIHYGDFCTEILLNWHVDREAIEATYHQGFLSVRIRKAGERRIPVRVPRDEKPQP